MMSTFAPGHSLVLADTTDMPRDEWLARRRNGIGGSDAAALCGLSRWQSRLEVWAEKTGVMGELERETEAMRWGTLLEGVVRQEVAERTGVDIRPLHWLLAHPDRPWQQANVDGLACVDVNDLGIYEGKTSGTFAADEWAHDEVPDQYVLQGQHYLAVTGLPWVLYGVLIGGQRLEVRKVDRDEELIEDLTRIEEQFWHDHVEAGIPPEPDGSKACTDLMGKLWDAKAGSVLTVDPDEVADLIGERALAIEEETAAGERRAAAENRLKALLGEHEEARSPAGRKLFTWKAQERRGLDTKALEAVHPELVAEFTTTTSHRRLYVPKAVA